MRFFTIILCFVTTFCGCAYADASPDPLPPATNAAADNLRGMWVSYLELDAAFEGAAAVDAAAYIDSVMETCAADGFNTVFFHVRAKSDAYYSSTIFKAAESAAKLLAADFDPLAYAVEAAHKNGLSLHAWINPYRIGSDRSKAVCEDIYEWEGNWYYIPTSATAQRYILQGVREIIQNYAVDGVQYDDYFYPSGLPQTALPYETPPGTLSVLELRRAAVSGLVAATYSAVHQREGCLFGVSPAADINRNETVLCAAVSHWLRHSGYVDYICPQVYSGFDNETLPFCTAIDEWAALERADGVRLYAGLALYKTGETDTFAGSGSGEWIEGGDILAHQADYAEKKGYTGIVLFRYNHWKDEASAVRQAEVEAMRAYLAQ